MHQLSRPHFPERQCSSHFFPMIKSISVIKPLLHITFIMPMQLFSLHATVNPSFSLTSFFPSFLFFAVLILLQFFVIYPDQHRIHNFVISCELFQVCRNSFDAVLNDAQKVLYSSLFSCTHGSDNGLSHFLTHLCGSCVLLFVIVLLLVTFLKLKIF